MHGVRDDKQFLAVPRQLGKSVLAEIAGVGLFTVHDRNGAADFIGVAQDRLVEEGKTTDLVPAAAGVEGGEMAAAPLRPQIPVIPIFSGSALPCTGRKSIAAFAGYFAVIRLAALSPGSTSVYLLSDAAFQAYR